MWHPLPDEAENFRGAYPDNPAVQCLLLFFLNYIPVLFLTARHNVFFALVATLAVKYTLTCASGSTTVPMSLPSMTTSAFFASCCCNSTNFFRTCPYPLVLDAMLPTSSLRISPLTFSPFKNTCCSPFSYWIVISTFSLARLIACSSSLEILLRKNRVPWHGTLLRYLHRQSLILLRSSLQWYFSGARRSINCDIKTHACFLTSSPPIFYFYLSMTLYSFLPISL